MRTQPHQIAINVTSETTQQKSITVKAAPVVSNTASTTASELGHMPTEISHADAVKQAMLRTG